MLRKLIAGSALLLVVGALLALATGTVDTPATASSSTTELAQQDQPCPGETFPNSLHATRVGKANFYAEENGGFEAITDIPMSELACQNCHSASGKRADGSTIDPATYEPSCKDCHAEIGDTPTDSTCLGCHSRQKVEISQYSDVHRDMGMGCADCHDGQDVHGDGTQYASMLEPGAVGAECENCHTDLASNEYHSIHKGDMDCASCHAQSVPTCYNCHFDSQVAGGGKNFFKPPRTNFKFLMNREGEVHTATMQSLVHEGESFTVFAPYSAHTISKDAVDGCDDCHNNEALQQYQETGEITVTNWNQEAQKLEGPNGVIPIPPDYEQALQLDFLDFTGDPANPGEFDPAQWEFLKHGADMMQIWIGEPLTEEQMQRLQLDMGE